MPEQRFRAGDELPMQAPTLDQIVSSGGFVWRLFVGGDWRAGLPLLHLFGGSISRIRGFRVLQWVRLAKLNARRFRLSTDLVPFDSFAASHPSGVRICFQKVGLAGRGREDPLRVPVLIRPDLIQIFCVDFPFIIAASLIRLVELARSSQHGRIGAAMTIHTSCYGRTSTAVIGCISRQPWFGS